MKLPSRVAILSFVPCIAIACGGPGPNDSGAADASTDTSVTDTFAPMDTAATDTTSPTDAPATDTPATDAPATDTGTVVDAGSDSGSPLACGPRASHTGDGTGACSFAARTDMLYAAMNAPDFANAAVCGMCVLVTGPTGDVTVPITDLCPECLSGALDLSPTAFALLSPLSAGRIPITWHEVPCDDVSGPVVFHVYAGSNPWYLAFNVRNHRHRIANLERRGADGTWHALMRQDYNVWIESPSDAPIAMARLRATDILGSVVEADVPINENTDVNASDQFPACTP